MFTDTAPMVQPISTQDRMVLQKLMNKAWLVLLRTYGPLFLALAYLYYKMIPGGTFRGRSVDYGKMTRSDYDHVYWMVALFFGAIFLFFLVKDFRRLVLPLQKEMRLGNKYCNNFFARKYKDPIYGKCLLFYPGKADHYIELSPEDFDAITNGEQLHLDSACITGEVLSLRNAEKVFSTAAEFTFSEVPIVNSLRSE